MPIHPKRIRQLKVGASKSGPVIYWMSRDQRVHDNWALLYAQQIASEQKAPLLVVFCLVPQFLEATIRQYGFMLSGLVGVEKELAKHSIPFLLVTGSPENEIPKLVDEFDASVLISDFSPLKISQEWKRKVSSKISISFYEVDAHNIVPCWEASPKLEFGAYTIRPKIHKLLPIFLTEFPKLKKHSFPLKKQFAPINWSGVRKTLKINFDVSEVDWILPGEKVAHKMLSDFIENRLATYDEERNDPNKQALSNLSPYLHFGQISAQRVALAVSQSKLKSKSAFLEELIVRRELSDNFCFYNSRYDSFDGFPDWAKKTLNEHCHDKRDHIYSLKQFELSKTHDPIWNAAQTEMVMTGKMHGYMRMYWAKKILEWTQSPEDALKIAIHLNDKYELDGRDPNGYVGVAWSIGGVHDRAWNERPVFGKIRFMNDNGLRRKFDVAAYVEKFLPSKQGRLEL